MLCFVNFGLRNRSSVVPVLSNSVNNREFTVIIVHKTDVHVSCMIVSYLEKFLPFSTVEMDFHEF